MPQAGNIAILKDGVNTVTFKPKSVAELSVFQDDTSATVSGRPEIKASHRLATDAAPGKTRLVMKVPVEETVDGVVQVTRESTVIVDVLTAPGSTATERSELRVLASNLLLNSIVTAMIEDGERVW